MNCEKWKKRAVDFLAGETDEKTAGELKLHLNSCDSCRKEYEDCKFLMENDGIFSVPEFDAAFWEKRLDEVKLRKKRGFQLRRIYRGAIATFAAGLIIMALLYKQPVKEPASTFSQVVEEKSEDFALRFLPYAEENLLEMVEYLDDESAGSILEILFENEIPLYVYYNAY